MTRTHKNVSKVMALIVCMTMMFTFAGGNWAFAEYDGIAVGTPTETAENGSYTVTVNMKNNSAAPADATLIAAVYQGGTLFSVKSDSKNIAAGANADFSAAAELPSTGSYTCRYFTWDSFKNLKPIVNGLPGSVENSIVKTTGNTCAYITWNAASDDYSVASYNIYRDGAYVGNSDTTSFYDMGLADGEEYIYTVYAVDNAGEESEEAISCYGRTADNYAIDFGVAKASSKPYWSNGPVSVPAQEISSGAVENATYEGVDCVKLGSTSKIYFKLPSFINNGDGTPVQMVITYYEPVSSKNLNLEYSYYNSDGSSVTSNPTQSMSIGAKDIDRNRWRTQVVTLENSSYGIFWDSKTDRDFRINNQTVLDIYIANVAFVKNGIMQAAVIDANSNVNASNNIIQTSTRTTKTLNGVKAYDIQRTAENAYKLDVRTADGYFDNNKSVKARVGITYYDAPLVAGNGNRLFVQYKSGDNEAVTDLPFVNYTGSQTWKTVYFDIDDLYTGEGNEWMVRVNSTGIAIDEHMYVSKVTIAANDYTYTAAKPTIFLAGDSTMQNYTTASPNTYGWGGKFADYMTDDVVIKNYALGGQNTAEFLENVSITDGKLTIGTTENNWRIERILSQANPGDYLFIQFGHNDFGDSVSLDAYEENLEKFVIYAKRYGIKPVLLTSIPVCQFTSEKVWQEDDIESYRTAMKEFAGTNGVPVIDMSADMVALLETMGQTSASALYNTANSDKIHLVEAGAEQAAKLVAKYLANYSGNDAVLTELGGYVDSDSITDAKLDAPANLRVTAEKATSISLSWDGVEGATGYKVYRGTDNVATVSETTYKDVNLNSGTAYTYTVTALNGETESEKSSAVKGTTRVVASLEFNQNTIDFAGNGAGKFTGTLMSVAENNSIDPTYDAATAAITLTEIDNTPCALFNWLSIGCPNMTFILDETVTAPKGADDNLWAIVTYYTKSGSTKTGKIEYVDDSGTSTNVKYSLNKGWNTMAIELTGTASGVKYGTYDNRFRINPKDTGVSMYISKIEVTRGYEADQ